MAELDPDMLSPQWEKFAVEYARLGNASEAARIAGYAKNSAGIHGHHLLKNPKILARVRELQAEWHEQQVQAIKAHVAPAINALGSIVANGGKNGAQAQVLAACALLDRAGFKPIDKAEVKSSTVMQINITPEENSL